MFRKHEPDVTDGCRMPEMGGVEAIKLIPTTTSEKRLHVLTT